VQRAAVRCKGLCSVLQCVAVWYVLRGATHCIRVFGIKGMLEHLYTYQHTATHCNTLQHTATHCNTLNICTHMSHQMSSIYLWKEDTHEKRTNIKRGHTSTEATPEIKPSQFDLSGAPSEPLIYTSCHVRVMSYTRHVM